MCTRYLMELPPEYRPYIEASRRSPLMEKLSQKTGRSLITEGEIKPGDITPVFAADQAKTPAAFPMAFGFPLGNGGLLLNARMETAAEKPMFRDAWRHGRCIIPAAGYFEWQHLVLPNGKKKTGDKYMFRSSDSKVIWLCGLYRITDGLAYYVILTRQAALNICSIHDRMPLLLSSDAVRQWIDPDVRAEDLLNRSVSALIYEKAASDFIFPSGKTE